MRPTSIQLIRIAFWCSAIVLAIASLPLEILELAAIKLLTDNGVLVICVGGGGVPVTRNAAGKLEGAEAVIDKDRASEVLARNLDADMLLMLTDVDAVYVNYGDGQRTGDRQHGVGP